MQAEICRWTDVEAPEEVRARITRIFFAASNTQTFTDEAARQEFQWRWLDQFLEHDPDWVYLARAAPTNADETPGDVAGYLVAHLKDPAESARFRDLGYFQAFKHVSAAYPTQLHVNLSAAARGHGIGAELISAFMRDAKAAGCPGVHVVTGAGARNVTFYERAGFQERARTVWNGTALLFLARAL